jgi:hypothetical protein
MGEQEGRYVRAAGMRVDIKALQRLSYRCEPRLCAGQKSCCSHYDVWMDDREARRVEHMLPAVRRLFPERTELRDRWSVLRRIGAGRYVLRKNARDSCILSYRDDDGRLLCTLHTAALRDGVPLQEAKPQLCLLWPLSLSRAEPPVLGVQDGVRDFPCCASRHPDGQLHPGVAETLQLYFGPDVADEIKRRAGKLHRTRR